MAHWGRWTVLWKILTPSQSLVISEKELEPVAHSCSPIEARLEKRGLGSYCKPRSSSQDSGRTCCLSSVSSALRYNEPCFGKSFFLLAICFFFLQINPLPGFELFANGSLKITHSDLKLRAFVNLKIENQSTTLIGENQFFHNLVLL